MSVSVWEGGEGQAAGEGERARARVLVSGRSLI